MNKLVVTNIRLTKEELTDFREVALEEGQSLSEYIRSVIGQYIHQKKILGKADTLSINLKRKRSAEAIWDLKPFKSGIKDASLEHDKYIY